MILVRLPDPVTLGRDPDSEMSLAGMQMLLLLVLGCAVQGPSKEAIIEDIKKLPFSTQHAIVECIQQVRLCSGATSDAICLVFVIL